MSIPATKDIKYIAENKKICGMYKMHNADFTRKDLSTDSSPLKVLSKLKPLEHITSKLCMSFQDQVK